MALPGGAPHRKQAGDVPPGDDERVALGDGEGVGEGPGGVVLQGDAGTIPLTERATALVHDTPRVRRGFTVQL
jgi:hypothetical protein